jgi:hypothetical protein
MDASSRHTAVAKPSTSFVAGFRFLRSFEFRERALDGPTK